MSRGTPEDAPTDPATTSLSDGAEVLLGRHLDEIGRYRLLDRDAEVALARTIESGRTAQAELAARRTVLPTDRRSELQARMEAADAARRTFVESNLRLVVSIAKHRQFDAAALLDRIAIAVAFRTDRPRRRALPGGQHRGRPGTLTARGGRRSMPAGRGRCVAGDPHRARTGGGAAQLRPWR
jgi:hypothetical protein